MNFILLSSVSLIVAIVTTNSSTDKVPEEKARPLRDKNALKKKKKKMKVLDAEMARVASIERGSCVCLFHWHQLRARDNVCSCPLSGHSVRLSRTSLPVRLYRVMDEVGRRPPTYRPGTKWCISCRKNADKMFSTMDYYQMPCMRIRLCSNFMFSL